MLEKLQAALEILNTQRAQLVRAGWFLQQCWLVQVKPGGTARTTVKYWQVRSRQPIFDGKKLKHLKLEEVDDYKAAIARGRQLTQIDRQIEKLQHQIAQQLSTADIIDDTYESLIPLETALQPLRLTVPDQERSPKTSHPQTKVSDLDEQEHLVQEVLSTSQELRVSVRQSGNVNKAKLAALLEQKRLVQEMLVDSQKLRASLRQSRAANRVLREESINLRRRDVGDR